MALSPIFTCGRYAALAIKNSQAISGRAGVNPTTGTI